MAGAPLRIGIEQALCTEPLIQYFQHSPAIQAGLLFESSAQLVDRMMLNECNAAFMNPIEYAKSSSDFCLYPSVAVSSYEGESTLVLCVKKDIHSLSTVAFGSALVSEIILTKILLAEQFESEISFVPSSGTLTDAFKKADAVLLSGAAALQSEWDGVQIDLIAEWSEMTDLPFVHLVCAGKRDSKNEEIFSLLERFTLPEENGKKYPYEYFFNAEHRASLDEFFHLAYYHGILPDIPDIAMFEK